MKKRIDGYLHYFINLIFPALVFGAVTGILTSVTVTFYKWCASHVIHFSEKGYEYLRIHPLYIIPVLAVFFLIAVIFSAVYKKSPNLKGGGIPTSIGILRGMIRFRWIENVVGVFFLSLMSFLAGVPLGNEGPSVQMGTAIGKGGVSLFAKKHRAWERYSMTGGACAGFSVATGAPVSGIMFAIEEAHQRISPTILMVASVSVMFSRFTTELVSPIFGVNASLFPKYSLPVLSVREAWIPFAVGGAVGIFAVLFLRYYRLIKTVFTKKLAKLPNGVKIFLIFAATLAAGYFSFSYISTGHELILSLIEVKQSIGTLLLILIIRATVTLCANTCGITGGIFLPILALGVVASSLVAGICIDVFGVAWQYYTIILVLGIAACIAGMMKMPLTAVIFSVEALSCHENILYVIVAATTAFAITEIFGAKSINDSVIESRMEQSDREELHVFDTFVAVREGSFAVGKQIRDIFWPRNLFVLSVRRASSGAVVDEHGGKELHEGDVLHVRYSTSDEEYTRAELVAIVGEQNYAEMETKVV